MPMLAELTRYVAHARSIQRSLALLETEHAPALIIAPSTLGAFALARAVCRRRPSFVTAGPISSHPGLRLVSHACAVSDIVKNFAGQSELPRSVISFPDQQVGTSPGSVVIPFLGSRYAFSSFDALIVARHKPPVYALSTCSRSGDFALRVVRYGELFAADGRLISLPGLLRRLLMFLEEELARPTADWLARDCLRLKSESVRWLRLREELKDVECLLRLHLQSRYCDRLRTETALAAVVARQKRIHRSASN
jgi:hypothetical protein